MIFLEWRSRSWGTGEDRLCPDHFAFCRQPGGERFPQRAEKGIQGKTIPGKMIGDGPAGSPKPGSAQRSERTSAQPRASEDGVACRSRPPALPPTVEGGRRSATLGGGAAASVSRERFSEVGVGVGLLLPGGEVFQVIPDLRQGPLLIFLQLHPSPRPLANLGKQGGKTHPLYQTAAQVVPLAGALSA